MNEPTKPNDGGPAFPLPTLRNVYGGIEVSPTPGVSKRELFSAMAMQGLIFSDKDCKLSWEQTAAMSIRAADALLAELEKGGQSK